MINVSVVIPVYNRIEYIEAAVKSVVSQNLQYKEIIIVDDGSSDDCRSFLEDIVAKYDEVTVIHQEHKGAGVARNLGLKHSHGKYVCFLDSDDFYYDNTSLKLLFERAEENCALICGGNIVDIYGPGKETYRGYVFDSEGWMNIRENPVMYGHTRYIYNRQFLIDNGIKYDELIRLEDPPFVLKAFATAKRYYVVEKVIYGCRKYERSQLYPYDVVIDILKGANHCLDIIKEYHLISFESFLLENILRSIYEQCCYFSYVRKDAEIISLLHKFDKKLYALTQKNLDILNESEVKKWLVAALDTFNKLEVETDVLIYGAGIVARKLTKSILLEQKNILGIAVTDTTNNEPFIEGIPVKNIKDYELNKDCLVIIAVSTDKSSTIEQNLNALAFNNYSKIDERGIKLITMIMQNLV